LRHSVVWSAILATAGLFVGNFNALFSKAWSVIAANTLNLKPHLVKNTSSYFSVDGCDVCDVLVLADGE